MAQSNCVRCGVPIRWVTVSGEGKIPLDAVPTYNGRYRLSADDLNQAERIDRPGLYGYTNHDDSCAKLSR